MRISFLTAAGLALAAALAAPCAFAQSVTFPSPAFRGGNTDWQIKLSTQQNLSVSYQLNVPEAKARLTGPLTQGRAPQNQYVLTGVIGQEKSVLTVKIAAVQLGDVCKDNKGNTGGAYGPYTYAILVVPDAGKTGPDHKAWPKRWYGCGNFTLD
ncbi:MAG: hypothetical protein ACREP7_17690 [Lysobacter sp.]